MWRIEPAWNQWGRGKLLFHGSCTGAREVGFFPFPACQTVKNWIPTGGLGWDITLLTAASRQPICCHCHAAAVTQQSCQGGHLTPGLLMESLGIRSVVHSEGLEQTVGMGNLMDLGAGRMWSHLDFLGKRAWNQWAVVGGAGEGGRICNSCICSLIGKYNTGGFALERKKILFEKKVTCLTRRIIEGTPF